VRLGGAAFGYMLWPPTAEAFRNDEAAFRRPLYIAFARLPVRLGIRALMVNCHFC